jgi:small-conductance mechanosensitive channel
METIRRWFEHVKEILEIPLIRIGEIHITFWSILYLFAIFFLLLYLTAKARKWIAYKLLVRTKLDLGERLAIGSIFRYVVIAIGFMIILQTSGIDLTTLNILAGAVGIGVGFGLQNIANNFISGLIILFERPIKIGDRIQVGDVEGDVAHIGARSTTVITNDDISMIIPNSKFINEDVVNWSHTGPRVRFKIPVGVAYGSDVRLVEKLLLEVARENQDVLHDPPPTVRFMAYGDSALQFELRAWSSTLVHQKGKLFSDLNFGIYDKFKQHGVQIPFPQRDVHIRSGTIELKSVEKDR